MTFARLLDILIPRFVTEDAAAEVSYCGHCDQPHVQPVCALKDVRPGEAFDGIVTMRFFNLFGFCLLCRWDTEMRPWVNPHNRATP